MKNLFFVSGRYEMPAFTEKRHGAGDGIFIVFSFSEIYAHFQQPVFRGFFDIFIKIFQNKLHISSEYGKICVGAWFDSSF
jgi:hypothetical protein